jgi:phosphoglycolate phosphatase-like HAD superfamily hydrolase
MAHSFMVGDRYGDVDVGRAVGGVTILVAVSEEGQVRPDHRAAGLRRAVATIQTLTRGAS